MESHNQTPVTFAKLWPTLEKCRFCTAVAVEFPRGFVTVGPGGKETSEQERARSKSDLGEKNKISGAIKVKSSLHDRSEMSALQKTHIQADKLVHTCTHNH